MRPTPIPADEVWAGAERKVIAPPDGDLTNPDIAPVEALVDHSPSTGALNLSVRCELEDDDLDKLQAGGPVWLTFWGAMVPWSVSVAEPKTPRPVTKPNVRVEVDFDTPTGIPAFQAYVTGVRDEEAHQFVAGCVEALQQMLAVGLTPPDGT